MDATRSSGPSSSMRREANVNTQTNSMANNELEQSVVRKLDIILLPYLCLFFLVNSLDRSNIGNAETAQFTHDAGLKRDDLNTAVALFFTFFVALQPVGAACGRRFGMRIWVPSVMVVWGICTALHIWVRQRWQLITLRILIGILESGFYPTTVAYMSLFYTRYEFGRRLGFFYGQYAIAGALGGLLSYLVFAEVPRAVSGKTGDEDGSSTEWKSWQVLFLLEGGLTVVIAFVGFFWLPDTADRAWFLTEREREWAAHRVWLDRQQTQATQASSTGVSSIERTLERDDAQDSQRDPIDEAEHLLPHPSSTANRVATKGRGGVRFTVASGLTRQDILAAFLDWKVFYLLALNISSAIPAAAFGVFLPLVVQGGFGKDAATTNLLTVPPFLAGAAVLFLFVWWSDRTRQRLKPILWGLAILLVGLSATVMLPHAAYVARYLALCILLGGSFIASPLTIAWLSGNIEEPGKRSVVLGINGWGNVAGIFSSLLFSEKFEPDYAVPFFITLACVMVAFVGYLIFRWLLERDNQWRSRVVQGWDDEDVQAEKKFGSGPIETVPLWRRRLHQLLVGSDDAVSAGRRRGEEKLTYTFGL